MIASLNGYLYEHVLLRVFFIRSCRSRSSNRRPPGRHRHACDSVPVVLSMLLPMVVLAPVLRAVGMGNGGGCAV